MLYEVITELRAFDDGRTYSMAKLILIAGLPGSGKSRYGGKLKSKVGATCYVDDYHAQANDNRPGFENGREYRNLIAGLKRGEVWVASDIEWCRAEKRREVEAALHKAVPHVHIEWHFLAAGEDKCRERVRQRVITSYSIHYTKLYERRDGICWCGTPGATKSFSNWKNSCRHCTSKSS